MSVNRYDETWAQKQASIYLAADLPVRFGHSMAVGARAVEASRIFSDGDSKSLVCAGYLHDIGYSPSLSQTGLHALDGARYLASVGAPNRLCALVAHHSCAYLEAELRGLSAQLSVWRDEASPLRDALWWADMTTTPDGELTTVHDRIEEIQKRYGPEDLVSFFIRQAAPELISAVERTEARLRAPDARNQVK